ncbi:MAG: sporulation protein YqfD [Ruminococcus sp.]|nr:sporulation protein YqfD [Ruminococcus sp.]
MLVGIVRWCRGSVDFTAAGKFPERLLNLAAVRGIRIWNPQPVPGGVSGSMLLADYRRIRPLAKRARVRTRVSRRRGLPFFVCRYQNRFGLVVGAALGAMLIVFLSQFLWSFRIVGAEHLSQQQIRDVLAENGVRVGVYKGDLDVDRIERRLLRGLDRITWVSVNMMGCTASVEVREKAQKPEIRSTAPCNVTAAVDGVITKVNVRDGFAAVREGSGVAAGELLVSGFNPTKQGGVRYMHADADIYADVISKRESKIPKQLDYYSITENKIDRKRLKLLWFEMPFSICFGGFRDKALAVREDSVVLNGTALPLGMRSETAYELENRQVRMDEETARTVFRNQELLYEAFARPGSCPVSRKLTVSADNDSFFCTFDCVFNENIAQTAEFSVTEE